MKKMFRRSLSLLLVLLMVASMLPTVFAAEADTNTESVELTQEDYASADAIFAKIDKMEDAPATKNASETELADKAAAIVMASESYVEGSLERNGNSFTWMTQEGIRCIYGGKAHRRQSRTENNQVVAPSGIYNEPVATKGGWPSSQQVYLIGPYYHDSSEPFTDQYKKEATAIAEAIGDTDGYTLYSGTAATVDKVAEAMSNGAVVIFDSHGTTDYENPRDEYDYVTGATSSYLCLSNKSGLTTADFNAGNALYGAGNEAYVNGTAIAQRMTKNSPSGIVWMAICLGMATDSMYVPFRNKGVEVVYGYSQSVTFDGDYIWEEIFWDNMCKGTTVATAVADMKNKAGEWDYCEKMYDYANWSADEYGPITMSEAREYYYAFPIVVSDEDTHPGQRKGSNYGADSLQTVKSTYTLFSQYDVTAKTNNSAYGTVSVSGSTITATPATGYFAQSATVTSGSATVTQNGNIFQVSASSDCTVQINFAAKTPVTVSFSGATVASQSGYSGDSMTLPTVEAPEGCKFLGWMTSSLNADTTDKPSFLTGSFIPTGNTTLYALYSYVDANSGSGTGDYVKVTETPDDWSGEYLIVYESGSLVLNGSMETLEAVNNGVSVTIIDNTISADEGDSYKFTIAPMTGGYSIQSASGSYIYGTSGSNKLNTSSSPNLNTISIDASGNADIVSNTSHLRYNITSGQNRFRYYKSSSYTDQKPIALYVKDGAKGTTYYTTNLVKCEHTNTQNVAAVAATCTTSGYTAGVQCTDCNSFISGHEVEAALGHNYNGVVTDPTATEQGYTTYTCSVCGDSYVGDYVDALGETFYVSFSVPSGITAIETVACGKAGITLPTAEAPEGYTFAGWSAQTVETTTSKPTILSGSYTATSNVTLYALYTYTEGGSAGSGDYEKVTSAPADWSGEYLIVYEDGNSVFDSSLAKLDAVSNYKTVAITNNTISAAEGDPYKFIIAASGNGYSIQSVSGNYIGRSSDSNGMEAGTSALVNTISLNSDGNADIIGSGGAYLRFNATSGQTRFRYFKSSTYGGQKPVALYVKTTGGTTYYTTNVTQCEHANIKDVAAVAATCTAPGFTAGVYCNDCEAYISGHEVVAALGHNYNGVVTDPTATEQGYTTYTCANCGDSYVSDYTPALGVSYTVSFSVPSGVGAVGSLTGNSSGITLPTAGAPEGYTFQGWSAVTVQETTEIPDILTGTYVPTANTTLYAVYSREETVSGGNTEYVLTDIADISDTDEVVVTMTYSGTVYALSSANGTSKAPAATIVTVSGNKLSAVPAADLIWNIGGSSSGYIFYPNGSTTTWLYCTSTNNGVRVGTNTAKTFTIDASSGYLKHSGTGRYVGVYRTNPDWRCYTNTTSNIAGQTLGFYVKTDGSTTTTYYTTVFSTEPSVALTHISLVPGKDALGYKAAAVNLPEGAHVEISLWVTENVVVTKATDTLRLINILAVNGGEITVYAKAAIVDGEGNVLVESATEQTTMRQTIEHINDHYTDYSAEQLAAVKELISNYEVVKTWDVANLLAFDAAAVETVNSIYALAAGASIENVTLKGTITSIYTKYNEVYGNITVIISIAGAEDKPIKCYRLEGEGAAALAVGDVITVTGTVVHYIHTSSGNSDFQFSAGCTFTK